MRTTLKFLSAALMVVTLGAADWGDGTTELGTPVTAEDPARQLVGNEPWTVRYGTTTDAGTSAGTLTLTLSGSACSPDGVANTMAGSGTLTRS